MGKSYEKQRELDLSCYPPPHPASNLTCIFTPNVCFYMWRELAIAHCAMSYIMAQCCESAKKDLNAQLSYIFVYCPFNDEFVSGLFLSLTYCTQCIPRVCLLFHASLRRDRTIPCLIRENFC